MQKYSKNRVDKGIFMQYYTVILNDFNLQEDIYYEKDDGEKVKRTSVVADRVSFLSSKTKEIKDSEPEME